MSVLRLIAEDKKLILLDDITLTSGSINIDDISIKIGDSWLINDAKYYLSFTNVDDSSDKIKTELTQNDNQLTAKTSPFITNKSGEWYMGLYANVNDVIVKTSTVVVIKVEKGAATDGMDPFEPIRKEAYEKGRAEGYAEGYTYTQSLIDYMENCTDNQVAKMIEAMGSPDNLVSLPYANTEKVIFDTGVNGKLNTKYFSSIGLAIVKGTKNSIKRKLDLTNMQKLILTGYSEIEYPDTLVYGTAQCFKDGAKLEELYIDYLKPMRCDNPNWAVYSYQQTFANCNKLRIIGGFNKNTKEIDNENFGKISFHGCKNTTDMFKNCYALEEVRFEPLKLNISLSMTESSKLSQQSVMSLINALDLVTPSTITMHPDIKNAMDYDWWCSWRADTGLYYISKPETDPTSMPFSSAVAAKGWIIE